MVFHLTKRGICRPCYGAGFIHGSGMMPKKCPHCLCQHCNGTGLNQKVKDIPELKNEKCVACFGKGNTGMERLKNESVTKCHQLDSEKEDFFESSQREMCENLPKTLFSDEISSNCSILESIMDEQSTPVKRRGRPKKSGINQDINRINTVNDLTDLSPQS